MSHLLLFDIDGTLLHTRGAGGRAMRRVGRELFGEAFSFDGVSFGGRLDPSLFAEAAARCPLEDVDAAHQRFYEAYVPALAEELEQIHGDAAALPGVHALLRELRGRVGQNNDRGVTVGCLTGNYAASAELKLRHAGIDPEQFTVNAFGDEAPTRPDLVELALQRFADYHGHAAEPEKVLVIGDTEHDVACAKAHGCVAFTVLTGSATEDQLRGSGADLVIKDLSDPAPLWALLDD